MAAAKDSIQAIQSDIKRENLPWTAGATELTALPRGGAEGASRTDRHS